MGFGRLLFPYLRMKLAMHFHACVRLARRGRATSLEEASMNAVFAEHYHDESHVKARTLTLDSFDAVKAI